MEIINYSEASREAQVSRQCICNMKKANIEGKRSWPFFVFDSKTGDPGVDRDHVKWKEYVNANNTKRVNKKRTLNNTKVKISSDGSGNDVQGNNNIKDFVLICISLAKKYMSQEKFTKFKNEITVEYQKVKK